MQEQVRTETVGLPSGQGPAVVPVQLASTDLTDMELLAWIGNFGSSNAYIYPGIWSLSECEYDAKSGGLLGPICALTSAGPTPRIPIEEGIRNLTVYFEALNNTGQTETVTIMTYEKASKL